MIDWDFYSRRSGATLEGFLSDVTSYSEALEKFKRRNLNPPSEEEIMAVFGKKMAKNFTLPSESTKSSKRSMPNKASPKKRVRKKTSSNNGAPNQKDSDNDGKEYFRKVLPTKS